MPPPIPPTPKARRAHTAAAPLPALDDATEDESARVAAPPESPPEPAGCADPPAPLPPPEPPPPAARVLPPTTSGPAAATTRTVGGVPRHNGTPAVNVRKRMWGLPLATGSCSSTLGNSRPSREQLSSNGARQGQISPPRHRPRLERTDCATGQRRRLRKVIVRMCKSRGAHSARVSHNGGSADGAQNTSRARREGLVRGCGVDQLAAHSIPTPLAKIGRIDTATSRRLRLR
jgi:hypothetical protein